MHRRALLAAFLALLLLALAGCGGSDDTPDAQETSADGASSNESDGDTSDASDEGDASDDDSSDDSSDENSSDEEDYPEVDMPSGFPEELPLPEGTLWSAFRNGESFYLQYGKTVAESIDPMVQWFVDNGWELISDVEMPPMQAWEFGSPETNDYGHLRRVNIGYNKDDHTTIWSLDVAEN